MKPNDDDKEGGIMKIQTVKSLNILLSICIPTYNRGMLLVALVQSIFTSLPKTLSGKIEVVISDNHSTDGTASFLNAAFKNNPDVHIHRPERHLQTAEENLCFAISKCKGEYVWTLGDDDAIERDTFSVLADMLNEGKFDFLVFNSRSVSYEGQLKKAVQVPCLAPLLHIPLLDFVRRSGFWFILAGFSTSIFRRSDANIKEFKDILSVGRIYAHVVWLISCFHNKQFAFVNRPLVAYRENLYVSKKTDHWESVSKRENTFYGGFWSTGFLRLIDCIVDRGIIQRSFLIEVIDRNPDRRFYFIDEMLGSFLRGLKRDLNQGLNQKELTISDDEFSYFNEWARELWSNNIILVSLLEELQYERRASGSAYSNILLQLQLIYESRGRRHWFEHLHKSDVYRFATFRLGSVWFAIRDDEFPIIAPLLETLDFETNADQFGVATDERSLIEWVRAQPPRKMQLHPEMQLHPGAHEALNPGTEFNARGIASLIANKPTWHFKEWYRIVRALNKVARRSVLQLIGFR